MAMPSRRRALLLSGILCGVLCSSSAFTVRSGADVLSSSDRHQQKYPGLTNRSSPDVFVAGNGVALSVASGGAAASSHDGPSRLEKLASFTSKNFFLLGMMVAVALARAFPHVSRKKTHTTHHRTTLLSHTSILSHTLSSIPNVKQSIKCNSLAKMEEFCVQSCSLESMA